jgi:hypothetical protein
MQLYYLQLTALVRSNLSKLERKVIVALVTTDVHARDIVEDLMNSGTTTTGSFTWQQQLRFETLSFSTVVYFNSAISQILLGRSQI